MIGLEVTKIYTTPKLQELGYEEAECLEVTKIYTTPKHEQWI